MTEEFPQEQGRLPLRPMKPKEYKLSKEVFRLPENFKIDENEIQKHGKGEIIMIIKEEDEMS